MLDSTKCGLHSIIRFEQCRLVGHFRWSWHNGIWIAIRIGAQLADPDATVVMVSRRWWFPDVFTGTLGY